MKRGLQQYVHLVSVIMFVFGTHLPTFGGGYFVADPRGADGVAGNADDVQSSDSFAGTLDKPFATLTKACSVAKGGDTVFVKAGIYNQTLRPLVSGTREAPLVFRSYAQSGVVIRNTPGLSNLTQDENDLDQDGRQYGIYLYGLSHVVIDGISVTEVNGWLRAVKCRELTITNNSFVKALGTGTTGSVKLLFSNRNRIVNNTLHDGNDNLLIIHSDSNIVSGNNMMKGRHTLWCIRAGNFNVIRNNYFHNEIQKIGEIYDAENDPPLKYDCTKYNVVEGNQFAKTASSGNASPFAGIQFAGQRCIVRNNLFYETIGPAFDLTLYDKEARFNYQNRIYNNVFYKTDFAGISMSGGDTFRDNILKNNILYASSFVANDTRWKWYTDELAGKPVQLLIGRKDGFLFINNCIAGKDTAQTYLTTYGSRTSTSNPAQHDVGWWQSNEPALFKENVSVNPGFVDADKHLFELQQSSKMIDAGAFMTSTRTKGEGTRIPVADVFCFYSGLAISGESGDCIQLAGQTQTARIVGINYDSSIIIVDKSLSWTDSQMVARQYQGARPDIGAFEYGLTSIAHHTGIPWKMNGPVRLVAASGSRHQGVRIVYALQRAESLVVSVYTIGGKFLYTKKLGKREKGLMVETIGGSDVDSMPPGLYLVRLLSATGVGDEKRLLYCQ